MPDNTKGNIVGEHHNYKYSAETENFGTLPANIKMGEAAGVAVDKSDLVYVYNRGQHPIIVFNTNGDLYRSHGSSVTNG